MSSAASRISFRLGLTLSGMLVLLAYKTFAIGVGRWEAITTSWVVETCVLAWLWTASEALLRFQRARRLALPALLFYPLYYAIIEFSFAHTYFFDSAAERKFSLLDIDVGTVVFFFSDVLPKEGWLTMLAVLGAIHAFALLLTRSRVELSSRALALSVVSITLLTGFSAASVESVPSPLVDIARDFWEVATTPTIEVTARTRLPYALSTLDKSARSPQRFETPYKKVLVFVMETMTSQKLAEESKALPASTFVHKARAHAHVYNRYFPNNQDSRTGMLDMLGSRFIPYEAYTEEGRDHYLPLAKESSLVGRFNALGYESVFAVSQTDLELVVGDYPWKQTIHLDEQQIAKAKQRGQLCFVPYEFEHSCEDLAILPQVLDTIDRNERVFLYQEFIWGHAAEYNQASGKTNAQYYSAYLDAVLAHLEEKGLIDQTLIVLTSDHGFRDKALQRELYVYQIPLLFYSTRFAAREESRLYSHIDFKDLLFNELAPGSLTPDDNPFVMITGPTGTAMTAVLTSDNDFLLWKRRGDTRYLLRHANLPGGGAPRDRASPPVFAKLFDQYRARFDRLSR